METEIDKLKKASKTKITNHKDPPISEATLNTDLKLLEFYEINRKLKNPISTCSLKIELFNIKTRFKGTNTSWTIRIYL